MSERNSGISAPRDPEYSLRTSLAVPLLKITGGGRHGLMASAAMSVQKGIGGGGHSLSKSAAVLVRQ